MSCQKAPCSDEISCITHLFPQIKEILLRQHSCCVISKDCRKDMLHLFGFYIQLSALLCEQVQLNLWIYFAQAFVSPLSITTNLLSPSHTKHISPVSKCLISGSTIPALQLGVGKRQTFSVYRGN